MKFKVDSEIFYDEDEKYGGCVTINMTHVKLPYIYWVLGDYESYPSSDWIALLKYMKGTSSKCPNIGGGGNSYWSITVEESSVIIEFEISGSGGNSTIGLSFSFQEMIPIVKKIITNIKKIE